MNIIDLLAGVERYWATEEREVSSRQLLLAVSFWAVCVIALIALVAFTGFPVIWENLNDALVLLDGGWRVWNGQVPHRDFYSVVGPFPLGVFALGFVLRSTDVSGFPWALTIVGVMLSLLSWAASQGRLSLWWRLAVSLQILFLPTAVAYLGGGSDLGGGGGPLFGFVSHTSYAMLYNRMGWAALLIQMLVMLLPRRAAETSTQCFWDAVIGGVVTALCVFCKINFLIGSLGLTLWWLVVNKWRTDRVLGWLAGACAITFILWLKPGGVFAFFVDQWRLLHVSRAESHWESLLVRLRVNWPLLLILSAGYFFVLVEFFRRRRDARAAWSWLPFNFVVALALTTFVTTFNTQRGQVPGYFFAGLIIVEMAMRMLEQRSAEGHGERDEVLRTKGLAVNAACGCILVTTLCYDVGSIIYAALWKYRKPQWAAESERLPGMLSVIPIPVHFDEPTDTASVEEALERRRSGPWLNTGSDNFMTARQTARWINDGFALLEKTATSHDRIFVAAWFNPFNLGLGIPPATGGAMHWDYDRVVDTKIHPDVAATLSQVTIFMVPKRSDWLEQRNYFLKVYGTGLGTDFQIVGQSKFWVCWKRLHP